MFLYANQMTVATKTQRNAPTSKTSCTGQSLKTRPSGVRARNATEAHALPVSLTRARIVVLPAGIEIAPSKAAAARGKPRNNQHGRRGVSHE